MGTQHYYQERVGSCWKDPQFVVLQATFSSGVATVDSAASDPDITLTKDATGDYDVANLPVGKRIHYVGGGVDPASDTGDDIVVSPRSLSASGQGGKLLFFTNGTQADPPDNARLYATFWIEG